jgi:hypothetical protein
MDHSEIQELLGAYALDAVDPDEAMEIELHLVGCPHCQSELASYREVAGLIGYTVTMAPPALWEGIAKGLDERPPPVRLDPRQTPTQSAPVPLSAARKTVSARVFTAVLAVAAVVVVALGIQVVRLNTRTNHLPSTVASQLLVNSYQAAARQFDARHVSLGQTNSSRPIPAVILPTGTAYVDARGLPRVSGDRTYQLWGLGDSTAAPVSLAVMGSHPVVQQVSIPSSVTALALTVERAGGAPAPTPPILAQGKILG